MMKVENKQLLYHNELEIYTPTECMIDCLCCGSILRLYVSSTAIGFFMQLRVC